MSNCSGWSLAVFYICLVFVLTAEFTVEIFSWYAEYIFISMLYKLLNSANQIYRTRLLAASQPHTAAWIQTLPVPSLGLHLDDETTRVSVAPRLGAPICEPHHCRSCARPVTSLGLGSDSSHPPPVGYVPLNIPAERGYSAG